MRITPPLTAKFQRTRDADKLTSSEGSEENGAEHDARTRAFAARKRTAAKDRGGNAVQLVELPCEAGEIERVYMTK